MEKSKQILNLIDRIVDKQDEKREATINQRYEDAAKARDGEKSLLTQLDDLSGVENFFQKVYDSEKVLQYLESMVNSMEELKKIRPKFPELLDFNEINKTLVKLYKQRDEAYCALLDIRESVK